MGGEHPNNQQWPFLVGLTEASVPDAQQAAIASLTETEIRTLRLVYQRFTSKEIARREGVTPDAVTARLKRARAKLGGLSSVAASRLVHGMATDATYHPVVSPSLAVDDEPFAKDEASATVTIRRLQPRLLRLPFPTRERATNDDTIIARIAWPVIIATLIAVGILVIQAAMVGADRLR
ncbi:MAG: hypothetical protein IT553_02545 [Sphingomonadaceae bacterium]|nr:hypothetical protein [Sphingomonadaceae bacterium]